MSSGMPELTSNSYAVLALLSVRPWSAYELSKQVKRSMAFYWPRAERAIYDEPKKLVAAGLASGTTEATGKRTRTVYRITPKGRRAFSRWLAQASAPPQFESEALVRVTFGESGSKEDLLAAIRSLRSHALALRAQAEEVIRGYVEGRGPFPERLHLLSVSGAFNVGYVRMLERWATWAEEVIERWPDTRTPAAFPGALDVLRDLLGEVSGTSLEHEGDPATA